MAEREFFEELYRVFPDAREVNEEEPQAGGSATAAVGAKAAAPASTPRVSDRLPVAADPSASFTPQASLWDAA